METNIVHCKLIAAQNDIMGYRIFVFENLEMNPPFGHKYVMVTVYPRWQGYIPELGDNGFLTYSCVIAGEEYYDRKTGNTEKYKYTQVFFEKFVKENSDTSNKDIYL